MVEELLSLLEARDTDSQTRALISEALKHMETSLAYGEQVSAILRESPIWQQYSKQKHDLFIKNDSTMGALTMQTAPGVAGYLTSTSSNKPVPTLPPQNMDDANNPVNDNPLLG